MNYAKMSIQADHSRESCGLCIKNCDGIRGVFHDYTESKFGTETHI